MRRAITPLTLFMFLLAVFAWRVQYTGYFFPDEMFYDALPQRFLRGEMPFYHEWNNGSVCGILLIPFMRFAQSLGVAHEGVMLFMRIVFSVFWCAVAAFAYVRWRNFCQLGALFGLMAFVFNPPYNVFAISPHSVGVMAMVVAISIYATKDHCSRMELVGTGLALGLACLACPLLILAYFLFSLYAAFFRRAEWFWVSFGCAIVACAFCFLLFSVATPEKLILGITQRIPVGDHGGHIIRKMKFAVGCILRCYVWTSLGVGMLIFGVIARVDKKRAARGWIYAVICGTASIIPCAYLIITCNQYISLHKAISPFILTAMLLLIVFANPLERRRYFLVVIPTLLYAWVNAFLSNTEIYAATNGLTVAIIPAFAMLAACPYKSRSSSSLCWTTIVFAASFSIGYFVSTPIIQTMRGKNERIKRGPLAGLLFNHNLTKKYNGYLADFSELLHDCNDCHILCIGHDAKWLYMVADYQVGAYSIWLSLRDLSAQSYDILKYYWRLHPEKEPDVVFIAQSVQKSCEEQISDMLEHRGYSLKHLSRGNWAMVRMSSGLTR